jgi:gliding motility-associated-like protein
MTIRTKEWRNGILIGSIMRDVQVQVLTNCNFTPPVFPPLSNTNVVGGVLMPNGQVRGCVGQQLKFDYFLTSTDPDAILIGTDNHATSIGGNSNVVYSNSKTNNVKGTFTWTPGMTQTGNFTLSINLIDSTCRPPGILYSQTFSIPIFINGAVVASADTSVCPGDPAQLTVSGLGTGNYTWSYVSGPTGSLSSTTIPNPVASPYATTTYEVYSAATSYCLHNKDQVTVTTLPSPSFTKLADITTCPGKAVILDPQVVPDPGVTFNAKWTPNTYLSSNSALTPTSTPLDNITYTVVIGASNTQCKGFDTVFVDVLDGFKLSNIDTQICDGESVAINIVGDSRYTYVWNTDATGGTGTISDPLIINPTIKPGPVGKWKYWITASYEIKPGDKCNDSVSEFDIDVQPIPTVTVPGDAIVCYGDTMKLGADVVPANYTRYTYTWSPGQSLDNPNKIDPIFSAFNTTTLTFTASTPAGCKGSDEITLNVLPSDFIFLSADTAICPGEKANIFTETVGIKSFYWGDAEGLKDSKALNPIVSPVTTQVYTIYGRDTNSCYDTQRVKVTVRPSAMIDLPGSVKLYPGESYQMAPGGNGVVYNWFPPVGLNDPNIANPIAKPEVNTRYFVTTTTESGCSASDTIDVLVAPDSYIDMPNAFTPGSKSTLKPIRLGDATLKSFTIFNRWGQKMYESSDINQGWDGRYKEEAQPMGVYIYTIEAVTPAGRKFTKQGNITLIR